MRIFLKGLAILNGRRQGFVVVALCLQVLSGCTPMERPESDHASTPSMPPTPPAKPSTAQLDPQRLVGLNEAAVTDLLGVPSEVREEPPARVWHYNGDQCSVDVAFYFDLTQGEFRALTYSVEPAKSERAQRICLGGIQEAQRGGNKR